MLAWHTPDPHILPFPAHPVPSVSLQVSSQQPICTIPPTNPHTLSDMIGNKRLIFNSIPSGMPEAGVNLGITDEILDLSNVPVGGIITRNLFVSYDPYQRICMREPQGVPYFRPYQVHQPIYNYGVAQVVATDNPAYLKGDIIGGFVGTEEYTLLTEPEVKKVLKISNPLGFPLSFFLGVLGLTGLTA